ncbi:MAG: YggS family pyridoxal phosphate-dependent enzyme [Anaerolineales bacterium]|nr:YggS family pyridoxal phosphate-dependent enzyme [Anaerolineales bacterium]
MTTIQENYQRVLERIEKAAVQTGREPAEITLVAVTKTWPIDTLREAYAAGMRHFGENRTHELETKRPELAAEHDDMVWHFIGHLQSRQSQTVADYADVFHAADRLKIIHRLGRQLTENGRTLTTLLEVNISGEGSKSGFDCANWEDDSSQREHIQQAAAEVAQIEGLQLSGLMTMAPWQAPEAEIRAVFRRTRELRDWLQTAVPGLQIPLLSMGMTDDFELAIAEGATHVRVGRALFGSRQ